tara:strand:+ start:349 stop:666 length:318 start_codon:yes stop_codon:yes gene_type:complete
VIKIVGSWWMSIMDHRYNPLSNIPSLTVRHMVMQVLAWMWCIIFSIYMSSFIIFGISAIAHVLLLFGLFITATTFEVAKTNPSFFGKLFPRNVGGLGRGNGGEHE